MSDDKNARLEELLELAANDVEMRSEFCDELMKSKGFILAFASDESEISDGMMEAGSRIQIQHWRSPEGQQVIPFFSSLKTLQDAVTDNSPYIEIEVLVLFEMTLGQSLYLNPKHAHGRLFLPDEVERLLESARS